MLIQNGSNLYLSNTQKSDVVVQFECQFYNPSQKDRI